MSWIKFMSTSCEIASGKCLITPLIMSQHWFRWWLGAVRQQAITWTNVDPDLCRHIGHNELMRLPCMKSSLLLIDDIIPFLADCVRSWFSGQPIRHPGIPSQPFPRRGLLSRPRPLTWLQPRQPHTQQSQSPLAQPHGSRPQPRGAWARAWAQPYTAWPQYQHAGWVVLLYYKFGLITLSLICVTFNKLLTLSVLVSYVRGIQN